MAGSGLSAAVVAHRNQNINHRRVNARGCDIGIFVGPGVSHVTINSVSVTGANFQGILALDTSHLTVRNSRIRDNGQHTIDTSVPPLQGSGVQSRVAQSFGISMFGVSHSTVARNTVIDNGRGGIGIMDNGPFSPGTITQNPSAHLVASVDDTIVGNTTRANYRGCGIVVATQNANGHLSRIVIADNTVTGTGMSATDGPDIGGIVVAADPPGSSVTNVRVLRNRVSNSFEGGIIVNAEAFNSYTRNISVIRNTLKGNNWGSQEAPKTAGVIVFANPAAPVPPETTAPRNLFTLVAGNTITKQFYGIYSVGKYRPITIWNHIRVTSGGVPIYHG